MNTGNEDQSGAILEQWIRHRFSLTGADELHFPSFARMFRHYVEGIGRDFKIDPVTDHLALLDAEDPELGTCRAAIETGMPERFDNYLLARNAQHGPAYAEVFARINQLQNDIERSSVDAYSELSETPPPPAVNLAWADAHDTCLRLGHDEAYAKLCADKLLDLNFSLARAHEFTEKFFNDFQNGITRGYTKLRATMFAEYQSSKYDSRPAPIAELFSRIVEEQIHQGRSVAQAAWFARHYADCFDVDGSFDLSEEAEWTDVATARAEAQCRFRYQQDGDLDQFVSLFGKVANETPETSGPAKVTRFDEVERKLRESYFLSAPDEFSRRTWKLKNQSPPSDVNLKP